MNNKLCGRRLKLGDKEQIEKLNLQFEKDAADLCSYEKEEECPDCNGMGFINSTYFECPDCKKENFYFEDQFEISNRKLFCKDCENEISLE